MSEIYRTRLATLDDLSIIQRFTTEMIAGLGPSLENIRNEYTLGPRVTHAPIEGEMFLQLAVTLALAQHTSDFVILDYDSGEPERLLPGVDGYEPELVGGIEPVGLMQIDYHISLAYGGPVATIRFVSAMRESLVHHLIRQSFDYAEARGCKAVIIDCPSDSIDEEKLQQMSLHKSIWHIPMHARGRLLRDGSQILDDNIPF